MELFDINCFVGDWTTESHHTGDASSLGEELGRLGIQSALVRHSWGWSYDAAEGNRVLLPITEARPEWRPCLAATPLAEDMGALDSFLACLRDSDAGAVCLYPRSQSFSLSRWGAGELLDALAAAEVPVLIETQEVTWEALQVVLEGWPALPVVLTRLGYRVLRYLMPLLKAYPSLHVDTAYLGDNLALEHVVQKVGVERVVFGTGTPRVDGAGAVARLAYSALTEEQKRLVAAGNARRLMAAIRLDRAA